MNPSTPRDALSLSPNAITVLEKRYLIKDDAGRPVETPEDLFWRVARAIAAGGPRRRAGRAARGPVGARGGDERGGWPPLRRAGGGRGGGGAGVLRAHGQAA